jgi:proteasome assembly chaperone (PAC2) family protein
MKKILLSCVAIMFSVSIMAQNSVNLKMNLEKNKVYRFSSASEQTIVQTVNGNQQTIDSKTNETISIKMIDATADFMVAEVHFDTLISITNTMGKTVSMSSAREGDIKSAETTDVMSCIKNRLSKNAVYAKIDFKGKVLEIVNLKMLSDVIMKDTSSITLTGPVGSAVKTQIQSMISDNTLKTMIETYTSYLPGKQVSTGDNWNVTLKTNSGGMILDIITDYHLDGVNGNAANITAESNIKAAENVGPMISGGATITYDDIKGLSKSNMVIDIRTGLLIEDKAKTHIAGNLGVSGPGFSMQIPMDINSTSKVIALK